MRNLTTLQQSDLDLTLRIEQKKLEHTHREIYIYTHMKIERKDIRAGGNETK